MGKHKKSVRQEDISNSDTEENENGKRFPMRKRSSNTEMEGELMRKRTVHKNKTSKETKNVYKNKKRKSKNNGHNEANPTYMERNHERSYKRRKKDSKFKKSKRSMHAEHTEMIIPSTEELSQSSEAGDCNESRIRNREPDRHHRLDENQSCIEGRQSPTGDALEISLMSRRMLQVIKKNSKPHVKAKQKNHSNGSRKKNNWEDSYKKLVMKAESVLAGKFSNLAGTIKNCTERIGKSCENHVLANGKHVMDDVLKIIEKENSESCVLLEEKTSKNKTFAKRCRFLEKQLTSSEARCKEISRNARHYEKAKQEKTALEGEFKSVCTHNTALQTELSEVKQKFQEQVADKVTEIDRLKEVRNSLTIKAKEFREEIEKSLETQRVKHDFQLNKIRQQHAKEISEIQVQCSHLTTSNLDLKKRNECLMKVLKDNEIDSPAFVKSGVTTPEKCTSGKHSEVTNQSEVNTPISCHRQELYKLQCAKSSLKEISMLKADIASLRVSLKSKSTQVSELWKIYNIYVILTGLRIMKKELFFECVAKNSEEKLEFLFSLIYHDNGSSILYEKKSWKADRECPGFLNECSGQFFECKLAPLFLKNLIKHIFSPHDASKPAEPAH